MFDELKYALNSDMARLSVQANGGRSILFVYPPIDEDKYIASAKHILNDEQYQFIDLRQLLCQFIDEMGLKDFKEIYDDMGNEIFASTNFTKYGLKRFRHIHLFSVQQFRPIHSHIYIYQCLHVQYNMAYSIYM